MAIIMVIINTTLKMIRRNREVDTCPESVSARERKMRLCGNNAINSPYCMKCHLKPSRIQE